ncbi:MAG: glycosyltransferase family 1 protein [Armatimonadetes bacterium]|nr:MAG: glycosyltransferase family 1 protein [Armatimonadota bacterium]
MAWTEEPTPATRASVESRPRLLVVGPLPPPPGGGETVTKVLIESSLKEKYELRHFDTSRRVSKETMGHWTLANARWALRYYSQFRRVVREFRPDIVHLPIASNKPATIRDALFSATAARYGAKIVMHNHSGHFAERWEKAGKLWRGFVRKHLSRASAMVCLTPFWKEFFDGLHIGFLTEVIYNPVNPELVSLLERIPRERDDEVRVLYVGAICEPKGVPELIRVADRIADKFPNVSFTLVGGPQYPGHYERIMAVHEALSNRERIRFVGPQFGEDLARAYRSADLFVLPSHHEGLPMVILEAMAAGLPVVATRVGGIPDVIREGQNGHLVEPRDEGALESALEKLIQSADERQRIGERNQSEAIEKYSAEAFAAACDRLYQRVLAGGRG